MAPSDGNPVKSPITKTVQGRMIVTNSNRKGSHKVSLSPQPLSTASSAIQQVTKTKTSMPSCELLSNSIRSKDEKRFDVTSEPTPFLMKKSFPVTSEKCFEQNLPLKPSNIKRSRNPRRMDCQFGAVLKPKKLPTLSETDSVKVMISVLGVTSPSEFYVHLLDDKLLVLQPLTERLTTLYANSRSVSVTGNRLKEGSYWVANDLTTGIWCRVKIISLSNQNRSTAKPTHCTVFLVDWGIFKCIEIAQLRPLVTEILDVPCLAVRCRLDGIYPRRETKNSKNWPPDATQMFFDLVRTEEHWSALISSPNLDEDGALMILMLRNGNDEDYTLNEYMVGLHLASSHVFKCDSTDDSETEEDWTKWNPMLEEFISPLNTYDFNLESDSDGEPTERIRKKDKKKKVCRYSRSKNGCVHGSQCKYLHLPDAQNVLKDAKIKVFIDVPPALRLLPGSTVSIQVSCVITPFRFYAVCGTEEIEILKTLQASLQREYSTCDHHRMTLIPVPGDIVIAQSSQDDQWYRGRVVKDGKNDFFSVFFIDFGHTQWVHHNNMCNPLPSFILPPAKAVEMFLNGVGTDLSSYSTGGCYVLQKLVKDRYLRAKIIHDLPYVCVDLFSSLGLYQIDIASEMIRIKAVVQAEKKKIRTDPSYSPKFIPG